MNIEIDRDLVDVYAKKGGANQALKQAASENHWGRFTVDSDILSAKDIELLVACSGDKPEFTRDVQARRRIRSLKAILELKNGKAGNIIKLEAMTEALRQHLLPLAHHWVFEEHQGWMVPWYVEKIHYVERNFSREYSTPAHIDVCLAAKIRGKKVAETKTVWREALGKGCGPSAVLETLGLRPENAEMIDQYTRDVERFRQMSAMTGEQFLATGRGTLGPSDRKRDDNYRPGWNRDHLDFMHHGSPSRVVMDDGISMGGRHDDDDEDKAAICSQAFWLKAKKNTDREIAEEEGEGVLAPVHPLVCVFAMKTHEFAITHVSNLEKYDYNPALDQKLVLPAGHKELIDVLIGASNKASQDIVRGKAGGVIILCSGIPGTGKTLTAEVYSEVARRPLYTVQCSQLGIDPEALENELGSVLERAVRWKAILLIDEADVYIHDRGNDVQQNAIVGVFLRMLEYYSGVLFLTTNRETVVDDAIRSRCMAHIHYGVPSDVSDKCRIWRILSDHYGLALSDKLVADLVRLFPGAAGRTVKQLCRLAAAMSATHKVTASLFEWLATYQDVEDQPCRP